MATGEKSSRHTFFRSRRFVSVPPARGRALTDLWLQSIHSLRAHLKSYSSWHAPWLMLLPSQYFGRCAYSTLAAVILNFEPLRVFMRSRSYACATSHCWPYHYLAGRFVRTLLPLRRLRPIPPRILSPFAKPPKVAPPQKTKY